MKYCTLGAKDNTYLYNFLSFIFSQADKAVAEEKLEAARPALEEAEAALQVSELVDFFVFFFFYQFTSVLNCLPYIIHQTIKASHIATVRKLPKPPHLIMRIMDCVLILFRKRIDPVAFDAEKNSVKPSWAESLKVMMKGFYVDTNQALLP